MMLARADGDLQQLVRIVDLTADAAAVFAGIDVDAVIISLDSNGITRIDTSEFLEVTRDADSSIVVKGSSGLRLRFHLLLPFCTYYVLLTLICCVISVFLLSLYQNSCRIQHGIMHKLSRLCLSES